MGSLGDSPNHVTITDDNNEANNSLVFVPKICSKLPITPPNSDQFSPVTHITVTNSLKQKDNSKLLFSSQDSVQENLKSDREIQEYSEIKEEKTDSKSSKTYSSLQISEVEPFLGFSEQTINKICETNKLLLLDEDKDDSIILPVSNITKHSKIDNEINKSNNKRNAVSTTTAEYTMPSEQFLGFTDVETENLCSESYQDLADTCSEISESASVEDRQSLYDTCDSINSIIEETTKPIVIIERMNNSLFQKYYEKMGRHNSQENIDVSDATSEEYSTFESVNDESFVDYENGTYKFDSSGNTKEHIPFEKAAGSKSNSFNVSDEPNEEIYMNDDLDANEITQNDNFEYNEVDGEEEICVSFVTTRRKNEITNNASILVLDDSQNSYSGTDCDKTVLSNKVGNINYIYEIKTEVTDPNDLLADEMDDNSVITNINEQVSNTDTTIASTTTRMSAKVRESCTFKSPEHSIVELPEIRQHIVLQPGKKWERSLSIYRRMTTFNDHLDHSVMEDEDLHSKGRNYRQSVISTLKMQESQGIVIYFINYLKGQATSSLTEMKECEKLFKTG